MWLYEQMEPGPSYNIPTALRFEGALSSAALERALTAVAARHDVLRTRFVPQESGEPQLVLDPAVNVPLRVVDGDEAALVDLLRAESGVPFDLSRSVWRPLLIRLAPENHVLLVTFHHIAFDAWSIGIFLRELTECYRAACQNRQPALPVLDIQYSDFARWQRRHMSGELLEWKIAYWKQQLAGAPEMLDLSYGRPRPDVKKRRGARVKREMPASLRASLDGFSRQHDCTLFVTMLAAYGVLLHRYSAQDQVAIGIPSAGRDRPEAAGLIGCFINSLPLALDLAGDPAFLDFLAATKSRVHDVYAHGDLPFEKLVRELRPRRAIGQTPLYQTICNFKNYEAMSGGAGQRMFDQDWGGGLRAERFEFDREVAILDLELQISVHDTGLVYEFGYTAALFDAEFIEALADNYTRLLNEIASDPARRVSELPLVSAREAARVIDEWNRTAADFRRDKLIHEQIEEQAERTPRAAALVDQDRAMSYAELNARANRLAHYLRKCGVEPESRVAICAERSTDMVVGLLAIWKAGGAYVPLDPVYPAARLNFMLEDSAPAALLIHKAAVAHDPNLPVIDLAGGEWLESPATNLSVVTKPEHLSHLVYTSGSTGKPKSVMADHRGLQNSFPWYIRELEITPHDRFLIVTSFSFDLTPRNIFSPLMVGASVYLAPEPFDAPAIVALVAHSGITAMTITPTGLQALAECGGLGGVRAVVLGGEQVDAERLRALPEPRPRFFNGYAPTEFTGIAAFHRLSENLDDYRNRIVPIGKPTANGKIYILDAHLQPVPAGVPGEMYLAGLPVRRGYWQRPELTDERFPRDPYSAESGARMYKTGDLGRWLPDGSIEFLGRNDYQIKLRGFRIEPGEIEAAIRQHPGVRDALVVVHEFAPGDRRLMAYVVTSLDRVTLAESLKQRLRAALPHFMVPSAFVALEEFPRLPNKKIDRAALPIPATEDWAAAEGQEFVAPRNEAERKMAAIWQEVLHGVKPGVHDNFFDIGGNSLLAVGLTLRIQRVFGRKLPLAALLRNPTIEKLALCVEGECAFARASLIELQPGTSQPFFCVPGAGGHALALRDLAMCFKDHMPFYSFEAQTAEEIDVETHSIRSLAAGYLAELKQRQPAGRYDLGGLCWGALVALEMAQLLRASGEEVRTLVLLDPDVPGPGGWKRVLEEDIQRRWEELPSAPLGRKAQLLYSLLRDAERKVRAPLGLIRPRRSAHLTAEQRLAYYGDVNDKALRDKIVEKYQPTPYAGPMTVLLAEQNLTYENEGRRHACRQWAAGEYREVIVAGAEHGTWTRSPDVQRLADALLEILESARR